MSVSITDLQAEWHTMRALTVDLLTTCSNDDLLFAPQGAGPVWKQFRHIGRVHENYLNAMQTGEMVFGMDGCQYDGGPSAERLRGYFERLAADHAKAFAAAEAGLTICWPDGQVSTGSHLMRLLNHEILHHGQFMLHWRSQNKALPSSWQIWGD